MRNPLKSALVVLVIALGGVAGTAPGATAEVAPGAGATGAATDGARQVCVGPAVVCPSRFAFGLSVPRVLRLQSNLTSLETALGHRSDLIGSYQDFTEPMYTNRLKKAIASGRKPIVTWEPFNATRRLRNSYPLAAIASGKYDVYLKRSADQAKAVGKPFIVRFGHEMNGFWYPWSQPRPLHPQSIAAATNTPAQYVAAYRHVVKVFRKRGASNVAWMWSPNVTDANPNVTLRSLYPGDGYVDTIGLSGYLEKPTDSFESRYRATLTELATIGVGKPIILAETGAVGGETQAPNLTAMLGAISAEPRLTGVVYFSQPDKTIDYEIGSNPVAQSAIREALRQPRYHVASSPSVAFALTPLVSGIPRVGASVSASFGWRGTPTGTTAGWIACSTSTTPAAECTTVGFGSTLTIGPEVRGQYLRATLAVASAGGSDFTEESLGIVLNIPPAVTLAGVDMLSGAVKLRLPAAPAQVTNWMVTFDGGGTVYLPSTATEYFVNGLVAGTEHTVTLAACDCPSKGATTTTSFTLLAKPAAPTLTTGPGRYTATLPAPAAGQTGWVAVVDGVEEMLPLETTTVTRTGLGAGGHSFGIRAVSGIARTNPTMVYPQVPAAAGRTTAR